MRNCRKILLPLLFLLCAGCVTETESPAHSSLPIAKGGIPAAEIIVPETPSAPVLTAARELQKWVKAISGAELGIYHAPTTAKNTKIYLGQRVCRGVCRGYCGNKRD